ncbi:MAG TPA: hypothetical protein VEL76_06555 [Gemmataceae bacterium]|nr:hypothetical protein [Gemmataceae bacterium]
MKVWQRLRGKSTHSRGRPKVKFGPEGLKLLPEIEQLAEVERLRAVLRAIEPSTTPDELRRVWIP